MTRDERRRRLEALFEDCPVAGSPPRIGGYAERFYPWQGEVIAMLSYNPHLQSEFRVAIKNVITGDHGLTGVMVNIRERSKFIQRIYSVISEAIVELSLPEEQSTESKGNAKELIQIECL